MAAVDYFLKLDGIDGESTDKVHKGEIDILSFSWGEENAGAVGSGGGGGAGKVSVQDFNFTTQMTKASPLLFIKCATGSHIPSGQITCRKAGRGSGFEFLKIKLTEVLVSSYQTGGASGEAPTDVFSLNFAKVEWDYSVQNPDGSVGQTFQEILNVAGNTEG